MITSKEARELATGKNAAFRAECEAELDAAIRAAATIGATEVKLHKGTAKVNVMEEIAINNKFEATISRALDQQDSDYLVVRW